LVKGDFVQRPFPVPELFVYRPVAGCACAVIIVSFCLPSTGGSRTLPPQGDLGPPKQRQGEDGMSANSEAAAPSPAEIFSRDAAERYQAFSRLRGQCPVHRLPGGEMVAVSHQATADGVRHVENFTGTFSDSGALAQEDIILAGIPEPRHSEVCRIFLSALTDIARHEDFICTLAERFVDETVAAAARDGEAELMEGLARRLPSAVIAYLLGLPMADVERFARWTDELLDRQGSATSANTALVDLHDEFADYLRGHILARQADKNSSDSGAPDDIITRFTRAEVEGARLSVRAIQTQMMFFIIAGNGTTRDLIGNLLLRLTRDAALFGQVRRDRTLIPALVEEVLRLDSPVQLLARNCRADIVLDGMPVKAGERVLFSIASANRDEAVWPDAEAFKPGRERGRAHLAFGAGPHICPAAALARMEAFHALNTLLDRVSGLAFPPGYTLDLNPVVWANGPQTLRVTLTAG
jgi:cytochrome P450